MVVRQKTLRPVQFETIETTRESVRARLERRGSCVKEYVFPSRLCTGRETRQGRGIFSLERAGSGAPGFQRPLSG